MIKLNVECYVIDKVSKSGNAYKCLSIKLPNGFVKEIAVFGAEAFMLDSLTNVNSQQ